MAHGLGDHFSGGDFGEVVWSGRDVVLKRHQLQSPRTSLQPTSASRRSSGGCFGRLAVICIRSGPALWLGSRAGLARKACHCSRTGVSVDDGLHRRKTRCAPCHVDPNAPARPNIQTGRHVQDGKAFNELSTLSVNLLIFLHPLNPWLSNSLKKWTAASVLR